MTHARVLPEALDQLPAQPVAALRVLEIIEDPDASASALARVIEADPALSARVIRLANAPYYGLGRKVLSANRAVVLLGFTTVRALAVSAACSLLVEEGQFGPAGYWSHSITVAAAASVVAKHTQSTPADAFSAGLLHDVGTVLLHRRDPAAYAAVVRRTGSEKVALGEAERDAFDVTHAEIGAAVLESWRFPPEFVQAVASHHLDPALVTDPLDTAVVVGEQVAGHVRPHPLEPVADLGTVFAAAGIRAAPNRVVADVRREVGNLATFLRIAR